MELDRCSVNSNKKLLIIFNCGKESHQVLIISFIRLDVFP